MEPSTHEELIQLLSEYLDGALNPGQQREVEQYLASHPEAEAELKELRRLKHLLASREPLPPDPYFWTRLSARIEAASEEEEKNLLPFPRKYIPLANAMAILAVVAIGITVFLQRGPIMEYVSRQSEAVKNAYENNILKGAVMPLFAHIDRDNVLQFALFGTLPLDAKAETALRVDEQSEQGYHIEVGMTADKLPPPVTVKEMYSEVQPTKVQVHQIDSLLEEAKTQLARGAFYAENNALAVDPQLTKMNRRVLSDIAAVLAPVQRKRLDRFLEKKNAAYSLAAEAVGEVARLKSSIPAVREPGNRHEFVVITPDSLLVLKLNVDSLVQWEMAEVPRLASEIPVKLERLMKSRYERRTGVPMPPATPRSPLRAVDSEDFMRVEIAPQLLRNPESMDEHVVSRPQREKMFRFEFRMDSGGTVRFQSDQNFHVSFNIQDQMRMMDSLVRMLNEEQLKHNKEFLRLDSLMRLRNRTTSRSRNAVVVDTAGP